MQVRRLVVCTGVLAALLGSAPLNREEERAAIRTALRVPNPLPALDAESYGQFEPAVGVIGERVSYATAYGLRVPAIVYRPKQTPPSRMPGLVVVNGHGGDKYSWYAFYAGILYARAGAVVLTYDPIGEGERNSERKNGTRQHDQVVEPPEEMGRRMGGLMMTDVMQAVSYLADRRDVDPQRIAAVGYSMGSFVLGIACAVDTRLNFVRLGWRRESRWSWRILGFEQQGDVPGGSVSVAIVSGGPRGEVV